MTLLSNNLVLLILIDLSILWIVIWIQHNIVRWSIHLTFSVLTIHFIQFALRLVLDILMHLIDLTCQVNILCWCLIIYILRSIFATLVGIFTKIIFICYRPRGSLLGNLLSMVGWLHSSFFMLDGCNLCLWERECKLSLLKGYLHRSRQQVIKWVFLHSPLRLNTISHLLINNHTLLSTFRLWRIFRDIGITLGPHIKFKSMQFVRNVIFRLQKSIHGLHLLIQWPFLQKPEEWFSCLKNLIKLQSMNIICLCKKYFLNHLENVIYHWRSIMQSLHILEL